MDAASLRRPDRHELEVLPLEFAPLLLGAVLRTRVDDAEVALEVTEVEAYHGLGVGAVPDPGSHARNGKTARNATMWGEPGHLYVYLSHGIHSCVNVVCGPEGQAGGVLLRAGRVIEGEAIAQARSGRSGRDLARGPGRLGQVMGMRHPDHDGIDAITGASLAGASAQLWLADPVANSATGARVGVAGIAGTDAFPWRFWIPGDTTVSPFRPGRGATAAK
jgi:DNA-3-methyladenine glycosylase